MPYLFGALAPLRPRAVHTPREREREREREPGQCETASDGRHAAPLSRTSPSLPLSLGNLEENERIKAELAPTTIDEPKTPYHAPFDSDDGGSAGAAGATATATAVATAAAAQGQLEAVAARRFEDALAAEGAVAAAASHGAASSGRTSEDSAEAEARHRRFERLRKEHYRMREALRLRGGRVGGGGGEGGAGGEEDLEELAVDSPASTSSADSGGGAGGAAANGHH